MSEKSKEDLQQLWKSEKINQYILLDKFNIDCWSDGYDAAAQERAAAVKEALEGQEKSNELLRYIKKVCNAILDDPCFHSMHEVNIDSIVIEIDNYLPQPPKTESE